MPRANRISRMNSWIIHMKIATRPMTVSSEKIGPNNITRLQRKPEQEP
jgi:hypothetical protein